MNYKEYIVRVYDTETHWLNKELEFHRENDLPAIEYKNGTKSWFQNGICHRETGPAIECFNGNKCWYLNGKQYSEQEWKNELARRSNPLNGKVVEFEGKKYKLEEVV